MSIQDSLPASSDWMDQTLGALSDVLASYDDDSTPGADWNSPSYLFDFGSSNDAHFQFMSLGIQPLNDIPSAPIADTEAHQWSFPLDISMNDHPLYTANVNTEPTHSVLDENAVNGNCSRVSLKPRRIAPSNKGRRQCKRKEDFNTSKFRRARISPLAKTVLEIQFLREPYPKDDAIVTLATQTGLDKRTIKNWFCNTRSRGLLITPCQRSSRQTVNDQPTTTHHRSVRDESPASTTMSVTNLKWLEELSPTASTTSLERYLAAPHSEDAVSKEYLDSLHIPPGEHDRDGICPLNDLLQPICTTSDASVAYSQYEAKASVQLDRTSSRSSHHPISATEMPEVDKHKNGVAPTRKRPMFTLGGSSDGSNCSSYSGYVLSQRSYLSDRARMTTANNDSKAGYNASTSDDSASYDESAIEEDESAIEEDESEGNWEEDDVESQQAGSQCIFERIDSVRSLGSLHSRKSQLSVDSRGSRRGRRKVQYDLPALASAMHPSASLDTMSPQQLCGKQAFGAKKDLQRPVSIAAMITRKTQAPERQIFCTWPDCNKTFRYRFDWARHEEAVHYCPYHWICCLDVAFIMRLPHCFICDERDVLSTHMAETHFGNCTSAPQEARTFMREDQLAQHIKAAHYASDAVKPLVPKDVLAAWKIDNPRLSVSFLKCGFCGMGFGSWDRRQEHVWMHLKDGAVKAEWWPERPRILALVPETV